MIFSQKDATLVNTIKNELIKGNPVIDRKCKAHHVLSGCILAFDEILKEDTNIDQKIKQMRTMFYHSI